ncbi:MAG: hypothetical protein AB7P03_15730 [Kofleriaceae bacterium]
MDRRTPMLAASVVVGLIAAATNARADDGEDTGGRAVDKGTFGLGLILGEPTGVSAKLYLQDDQAIQAAAGSAFLGGGLQVHADYVFHPYILQTRDSFVLPFYFGPGVRLISYSDGQDDRFFALGLRAVAGLLFDFNDIPLDAFVEVAGVFEFGFKEDEGFGVTLNAGAGARYYF